MIAADVNHSDNISGQDIIQLRKLILGYYETFPNNTSWRFIDADHVFIDSNDPWVNVLPETYEIGNLQGDMIIDFRGVKIGDVNSSVMPNGILGEQIDARSEENLSLMIEDVELEGGTPRWIPIYASNFDDVSGYQLGLRQKGVEILDIRGGALEISETNYQINESGDLKMIWHEGRGVTVDDETILFEIQVWSKESVSTTEIFEISEEVMRNESYSSDLNVNGIELKSRAKTQSTEIVYTNLEMSQNEPNPWMDKTTVHVESSITG